ncbi:MAG: FAD-dependent tricarballylate dehydrogenase TcuA [Pseudomonadota bacterium]|nr:FAD-dependent tricarballylate dehydrogenase TcuA [Pseudomonadota bacterium]
MLRVEKCDVVVVGGGSAAFESAVSARQNGAENIIILEKAPEEDFGGNARFSHTGFRFAYAGPEDIRYLIPDIDQSLFDRFHIPPYSPKHFLADLNRVTQGRINVDLATFMVEKSASAVHWMHDTGIIFEPEKNIEIDGKCYFEPGIIVHTKGGGLGQVLRWREIALEMGIEIRYQSQVTDLLGNLRKIEGVLVSNPNEDYELLAPSTIICSGGFQASSEMRARYLGSNADLMRVRGSKYDTGEVLNMLVKLGAKTGGHWKGAHCTPIDADAPDGGVPLREDGNTTGMNRYDYPHGITVNNLGQRFYDEGEANHSYTYAKTGAAVLAQPGSTCHQIFDQKGLNLFRLGPEYTDNYIEAPTIKALAKEIGIQPEVLVRTVDEYNAACSTDIPFDPSGPDGKTTVGLNPNKSNWAEPISESPYRAYRITGGVTFSFGGIQIDTNARILDTSDNPIKGLYASGDVIGLFFHNYPSCTGQTRNAVFSRQAGESAARGTN